MNLKERAAIYLAVGIAIGIVIGLVAGHFFLLQTPQEVTVSGTASGNTNRIPNYIVFAKVNGDPQCYPVP